MTCNMLLIYFVTRHSYNSDNLYPDWQKPRRASLLPAVCRDSYPRKLLWSQPSLAQQRLLNFTGGPLGLNC